MCLHLIWKCYIYLIRGILGLNHCGFILSLYIFYLEHLIIMSGNAILLSGSEQSTELFDLLEGFKVFLETCLKLENNKSSAEVSEYINELAVTLNTDSDYIIFQVRLLKEKLDFIGSLMDELSKLIMSKQKFNKLSSSQQIANNLSIMPLMSQACDEMTYVVENFWLYIPPSFRRDLEIRAYTLYDKLYPCYKTSVFKELSSAIERIQLNKLDVASVSSEDREIVQRAQKFINSTRTFLFSIFNAEGGFVPLESAEDGLCQGLIDMIDGQTHLI